MRFYEEDLEAIQAVTTFLKGFTEPEGFFLCVSVKNEDQVVVGTWEYIDGSWVFVTKGEPV